MTGKDIDRLLGSSEDAERAGLQEVWDMMDQTRTEDGFPEDARVQEVWTALESHLGPDRAALGAKAPSAHPRRASWTRGFQRAGLRRIWVGAGAGLSLAATLLFLFLPVTKTAPLGGIVAVELSDGTKVNLNSGAMLTYSRLFDRTVRLTGEAFFDVKTSADPFRVETTDALIQVLGTRFSVRSWNQGLDQGTTVYLEEGSVELSALDGTGSLIMKPGEVRRAREDEIELLDPADAAELALWQDQAFIYRDEWVGTILSDFSRRYAVRVEAPESVRRQRMTLVLREPADERAVLDDLAGALGLRYQAVAGGYRVVD